MHDRLTVEFAWLPHGRGLELPEYQTPHSAGMDLQAAVMAPLALAPLQRVLVPCGFVIAIPDGYEAQIRPRSGLALKNGITLPNAPGTIDADYRGELKIIMINLGSEPFVITRGMRIAQLVIAPVTRAAWKTVDSPEHLSTTARGTGGFGSTGH
ncbi:MAG: dUTP diphosphatase [Planctomycetia bacterium]|nr:dUTP diphosphatase [Planctomycetia bacterium]